MGDCGLWLVFATKYPEATRLLSYESHFYNDFIICLHFIVMFSLNYNNDNILCGDVLLKVQTIIILPLSEK